MRSPRLLPLILVLGAPACAEPPLQSVLRAPPPAVTVRTPDWGAAAPEAPAERRVVDLRLAPVAAGQEITHLDVSLRLSEPPGEFGEPGPLVLRLAQAEGGETGWPEAVEEMYARDAEGALTLRMSPHVPADPYVQWRSDRRPVGAVRVGYRVRLARAEGGRYQGTRAYAHGFEGTGSTFLVLPDTAGTYRLRLAWDLASAGEGAVGLSSLGAAEISGPLSRLREADFMAGPLGRLSIDDGGARFEAGWLGRAAFDPLEMVPWAARVRAAGRALFHDADPAPFTLLIRAVPGLGSSFTASASPDGARLLAGEGLGFTRAVRFALARAIVRRWIGGDAGIHFDGPDPAPRWFTEGVGAHVARELLLRSGLATVDEVADELRDSLGAADGAAPALRGLLHAADVDAAVRARSGGRRTIDDLLLALLDRARAGLKAGETLTPPLPAGAWRQLLGAELGAEAEARFDAVVVRGEPIALPPGAFGPCFKREKRPGKGGGFAWVRDGRAPASCAGTPGTPAR